MALRVICYQCKKEWDRDQDIVCPTCLERRKVEDPEASSAESMADIVKVLNQIHNRLRGIYEKINN